MANDEWETPRWLFDHYNRIFRFTCDVAATKHNALVPGYFMTKDDVDACGNPLHGLADQWSGRVWCNPPYSDPARWVAKATAGIVSNDDLDVVVMLLPVDTSTRWYRDLAQHAVIQFLPKRIKFLLNGVEIKHGARFASMIAILGLTPRSPMGLVTSKKDR